MGVPLKGTVVDTCNHRRCCPRKIDRAPVVTHDIRSQLDSIHLLVLSRALHELSIGIHLPSALPFPDSLSAPANMVLVVCLLLDNAGHPYNVHLLLCHIQRSSWVRLLREQFHPKFKVALRMRYCIHSIVIDLSHAPVRAVPPSQTIVCQR